MEKAELVLQYLDVLAWPLVVVTVLVIFRGRVRELLGRITEGEALGVKAKFDRLEQDVREQADAPVQAIPAAESRTRVPTLTVPISESAAFDQIYAALQSADEVIIDLTKADDFVDLATWSYVAGFVRARDDIDLTSGNKQKVLTLRHRDSSQEQQSDPQEQP